MNEKASWWMWEETEKVALKLNIQKTKIMASCLITSWEIDGETVETVSDFIFYILGGSKITAHGDCSHEIKKRLLLGRKAMTNLDIILKRRDSFIHLIITDSNEFFLMADSCQCMTKNHYNILN